jgi:hypothetical protein
MIETTANPEGLCAAANTAHERFNRLAEETDTIKIEFAGAAGLEPDGYGNPCDAHYDIARVLDNVRRHLACFVIQRLGETLIPNIPLDAEAMLRELKGWDEHFDAHAILRYIQRMYVRNAKDKSLEVLLAKARRLLPHVGFKEERTLAHVVKKNVLILQRHVWAGNAGRSFEKNDGCDALQKVVRIVLEDADPVTVDAGVASIAELMRTRKSEELFDELVLDGGWIQKVRFHKNGKMLVTMKGETAAQRVATLLLDKPKTD